MNEIDIFLERVHFSDDSTIGTLSYDGQECYSLEDCVREEDAPVEEWKIPGQTAIPAGRYQVIRTMSNRFKTVLPLLLDVEGFAGIRIHPGNTSADTEGCILLGRTADAERDTIFKSRAAFEEFDAWLEYVLDKGFTVFINIA